MHANEECRAPNETVRMTGKVVGHPLVGCRTSLPPKPSSTPKSSYIERSHLAVGGCPSGPGGGGGVGVLML